MVECLLSSWFTRLVALLKLTNCWFLLVSSLITRLMNDLETERFQLSTERADANYTSPNDADNKLFSLFKLIFTPDTYTELNRESLQQIAAANGAVDAIFLKSKQRCEYDHDSCIVISNAPDKRFWPTKTSLPKKSLKGAVYTMTWLTSCCLDQKLNWKSPSGCLLRIQQ